MILSFRSRALKRFYARSDGRGLNPHHLKKIEMVLDMLEQASTAENMNIPSLDFHKLTGPSPTRWSVHINGNWCVTFSFDGEDASAVDYDDYH